MLPVPTETGNEAVSNTPNLDRYMKDILVNTNDSIDQITIEPEGKWISPDAKDEFQVQTQESRQSISIDDDGLILLDVTSEEDRALFAFDRDSSLVSTPRTTGVSHLPTPSLGTPNFGTPSVGTPNRNGGISNKRPAPQVIDLTISDDDDDEPLIEPPAKRLQLSHGYQNL